MGIAKATGKTKSHSSLAIKMASSGPNTKPSNIGNPMGNRFAFQKLDDFLLRLNVFICKSLNEMRFFQIAAFLHVQPCSLSIDDR